MADGGTFTENPFLALKGKKFPEKKYGAPAVAQNHGKKGRRVEGFHKSAHDTEPVDGLLPEEQALFLRAMQERSVGPEKEQSGGFALAEQCAMPKVTALKGKKERRGGPKSTVTAAAEPHEVQGKKQVAPQGAAVHASFPLCTEQGGEGDADTAAFLAAMGAVEPLQGKGREVNPPVTAGTPPPNGEMSLQDFMEGKLEFALSFTDEYLEGHVVGLDQMIMNKLRSGGLSPEAHLDLHGLNAQQAFEALRGFMRASWYKGLRTVLVVPGRGRNSPDGIGILRGKLQSWLTQDPFKRVVLAFCTAQPHDGGPGSVYVLLRKFRKKGRIYWERMPADTDLY